MAEAIRSAPDTLPKSVADLAVDTMNQFGVSAAQDEGGSWRCQSCDYFLFPEEFWEGPCDCVAWRWVRVILDLAATPQASSAERSKEDEGRCAPTPSAASGQVERKASRLRRSGSPWTMRVHTWSGDVQTPSHTISNRAVPHDAEHHRGHLFPQAEFDELVVGRWLHVEQMDNSTWWMNIGGVTVHVSADREGRPTRVRIDGPLDYDEPHEGCTYEIEWTELP